MGIFQSKYVVYFFLSYNIHIFKSNIPNNVFSCSVHLVKVSYRTVLKLKRKHDIDLTLTRVLLLPKPNLTQDSNFVAFSQKCCTTYLSYDYVYCKNISTLQFHCIDMQFLKGL